MSYEIHVTVKNLETDTVVLDGEGVAFYAAAIGPIIEQMGESLTSGRYEICEEGVAPDAPFGDLNIAMAHD
jgi:hypothetical protein